MPKWTVENRLELDVDDVREIQVRVVGGEVAITASENDRARIEVAPVVGGPIDVHHELGALRIFHPEWAWSGWRRVIEAVSSRSEFRLGSFALPALEAPQAHVVVAVPANARVDVSAASAAVTISGLRGTVAAKTMSGNVTLADLADLVDAKTVSGNVEARSLSGDLRAKTVSGNVTVVGGRCPWVEARTVSGDLTLDLELDPRGVYDLVTVSGDVGLRLPADPNVLVEAASVSGRLDTDFGLQWDDHRAGRKRVRGRLGDGGARLYVKTVSGALRIVERRAAA